MGDVTRKPIIAGNWKMNLNHYEANLLVQKLAASLTAAQLEAVEAVVLPPFTDLRTVQTAIEGDKLAIAYGAQDISQHASGAYTGEISGAMLAKLGCTYVVIGHSERREYHNETDQLINAKIKAAFAAGLTPIFCVGEGLSVREEAAHVGHCTAQVDAGLEGLKEDQIKQIVIAYEPVWAIGTGKTATPDDAQEVCGAIRARLTEKFGADVAGAVRIQYGGSVKAANIASIMSQPDVDGALVGGASLDAEEFASIVRFPEHVAR
ncbi:triose-phosphate isomerase [Actinoplanes sp. DH11]|uniref:triose-phosphate isomerase n=1 Tax=Actinoplanes sp. DH11 TaxID=2857011 RepID=UPI001E28E81B|nr:triose-phosphate isomerase [Actinoplanes sp. DH11]